MQHTAAATFELQSFDETTAAETDGGGRITRATIRRALHGDIEGEAVWETVMAYDADGRAAIVGLERVVGRIGDREGSFLLTTTGSFDGREMRSTTAVLPGSGTDDLAGLRGSGTTAAPHGPTGTFALDYELE
jgi:hypothetical protein